MLNLILPPSYVKEIDQSRLALAFSNFLNHLNIEHNTSVTVRFTNNRLIRQFNREWMGIDAPTDVLSFENAFQDPETGEQYLGDILISFEKARKQAKLAGHSLQQEVEMLLVHGLLHLVGHDHSNNTEWQAMSETQDEILQTIANPLRGSIHRVA